MKQEITFPWPLKGLSPNDRVHYMSLARAKKAYRTQCWMLAKSAQLKDPGEGRILVELEFRPPCRRNHDEDNLVASMKSGLDGLADALGVNDNRFKLAPPLVSSQIGGMVIVRLSRLEG